MVLVPVGHHDRRDIGSGQGISDFKVVLAVRLLSNMSPGRHGIVPVGIVHPFSYFVGGDGGVKNSGPKDASCVEIHGRVSLDGQAGIAVVAQNAAGIDIGDRRCHNDVGEKEYRERTGIHALRIQRWDDRAIEIGVKPVDVDNSQAQNGGFPREWVDNANPSAAGTSI